MSGKKNIPLNFLGYGSFFKGLVLVVCALAFWPIGFAHEKCAIRFLVDTPACDVGGYMHIAKKGSRYEGVWAITYYDYQNKVNPFSSQYSDISLVGCFQIHRGLPFPTHIQYAGGELVRAVELEPQCRIDSEQRSHDSEQFETTYRVGLNPEIVTESEIREEKMRDIFAGLVETSMAESLHRVAAYFYVHHPASSCGIAARGILERTKGAADALRGYEWDDPNACPRVVGR